MFASDHVVRTGSVGALCLAALLALSLTSCRESSEPGNGQTAGPPPGPTPGQTSAYNGTDAPPAEPADVTPPPQPERIQLPRHWFETDINSWVGKRWNELDLVRFMREKPDITEEGEYFLVYYSRTCDHCERMFRSDFTRDADLARKVVAIEIPESTSVMTAPNAWAMPSTQIRQSLQLPMETNWIITAPLTVRIVDGVVQCAEEGDHKTCMNR
jgi:hypothetical protein